MQWPLQCEVSIIGGADDYSDYRWRQQLDELVVQSELRIIEAEHRIETTTSFGR